MTGQKIILEPHEILDGYRTVAGLYNYCPPVVVWRGWEFAAYKRYQLHEPVLDIGCGDGSFFRLVWPDTLDVTGLDIDPVAISLARGRNAYRETVISPAKDLPLASDTFRSAFANCSLEHMEELPAVLDSIARCLKPGGKFLFSVVTDKFGSWDSLPLILDICGEPSRAEAMRSAYLSYHHLINMLSPEEWMTALKRAGFLIRDYLPIVPQVTGRFFLLLDHLWHIPDGDSEMGSRLAQLCSALPNFPEAFQDILRAFLSMEGEWDTCCGAVFYAEKMEAQ